MPETESAKAPRTFSTRAERSLKDADRLLKKNGEGPPETKAKAALEQAKVLALLELASTIRETKQT